MIAHLSGTLLLQASDFIVVQVNGVGYKIYTTKFNHLTQGDPVSLWTFYYVGSDNQPALYGFDTQAAYLLFQQFLKVQGVGPKIALKIVESDLPENINQAVLNQDLDFFTQIKGLGKKGAQKIILELRNVLVESNQATSSQSGTIVQALVSLGFSHREINQAIQAVKLDNLSDSEAIEKVLQYLGS